MFPHLNLSHFLSRHMASSGIVLNWDGSPSAIVHQYDRIIHALQETANAKLALRFAAIAGEH